MITIEEFKKKYSNKVRFVGLDLGSKRIGVSICDEKQSIATPFKTIDKTNTNALIEELKIIIPPMLFSSIIILSSLIRSFVFVLIIVLNGVAIDCLSSHIETPILLDPKSNPINLTLFECFDLKSSIVIILYILYLSDSLPTYLITT